jgi:hypothetical protein
LTESIVELQRKKWGKKAATPDGILGHLRAALGLERLLKRTNRGFVTGPGKTKNGSFRSRRPRQ